MTNTLAYYHLVSITRALQALAVHYVLVFRRTVYIHIYAYILNTLLFLPSDVYKKKSFLWKIDLQNTQIEMEIIYKSN